MIFVQGPIYYPCVSSESVEVSKKKRVENVQRTRFTKEEDELLKYLVNGQTQVKWSEIAQHFPNRTSRQCRERYNNYLRPNLVNGRWTKEEDELLEKLFEIHGPKWSFISKSFNSRSSVNVKNRHATLVSQTSSKKEKSSKIENEFSVINSNEIKTKINQQIIDQKQIEKVDTETTNDTESFANDDFYENMFSNFNACDEIWSNDLSYQLDFSIFA